MDAEATAGQAGEPDDSLCRRYGRRKLWLGVGETLAQLGCLASLSLSGASEVLWSGAIAVAARPIAVLLYLIAVGVATRVAALPLRWASEFLTECEFGLSTQSLWGWIGEWLVRSILFGALVVAVLYPVAMTLQWWPVMLIPWFLYFLGVRYLYCQCLYAPLLRRLYKVRLLRHESFHLPDLGRRVLPVYEVRVSHKTRRVDAHLHLAGRRSAIYVTDTLIAEFTDAEEKVVFAHEFGHLYDRIFLEERTVAGIRQAGRKLIWALLQIFAILAAILVIDAIDPLLGYSGAGDLVAFPLLISFTIAIGYMLAPLSYAEARRDEEDADTYALRITGDVQNYRSVMFKMRCMNLEESNSDPLARFLFDTHPSYTERLRLAERFPGRRSDRRRRR